MPEEGERNSVVVDGAGNQNICVDCNAVVFDTISDPADVTMRNEVAKHALAPSMFHVKIQGRVAAVINSSSLETFKDSERQAHIKQSPMSPAPSKRARSELPSYASIIQPAPAAEPVGLFTQLNSRPLFVNPMLKTFIPRPPASIPPDSRPLSPIAERLSSTEIVIAAGCMFPLNDMMDMGGLRSCSHSREEIVAITALAELTGGGD